MSTAPSVELPAKATPPPAQEVPWYVWCGVLAATSASVGGTWDVSWHRSIGRDTFWTPAHLAIYACGVLAAVVCGYLILATTFGRSARLKAASVSVLGFRAPLGAFIAAWGGIAMLTSAPFDNWWHAAYGLDVKIVSPPHTLLILGIRAVEIGVVFLLLAAMNRAAGDNAAGFTALQRLFLYMGGLVVAGQMFFLMEYTGDIYLHSTGPYIAIAIAVPLVLAAFSRASRHPWAASWTTLVYMAFGIAAILILPLFPAQPKLGPVYNQVDPHGTAQVPYFVDRAGVCPRSAMAQPAPAKYVAGGACQRSGFCSGADLGGMALGKFPDVEVVRQPLLRHHVFRLPFPSGELRSSAAVLHD